MYTELATMYAKYKPKMLMDFIKMNIQKLNIPKLINACERHYHWEHAVFLYTHYDEFDQAANTMMAGDLQDLQIPEYRVHLTACCTGQQLTTMSLCSSPC
ncbi:unnamed protein product [Symbiodinium sp. CCMP2592]|nr:unnamed protein product [Symbiodinium sp. CCMP2592]